MTRRPLPPHVEAAVWGPDQPAILDAVAACPDRGPVLGVSFQAECGCGELTGCRAGRGSVPGRVTLDDCLICRVDATAV